MAIALVGCHRSGTSMMSHLFFSIGLDIGDKADLLVKPYEENQKGHWENKEVIHINDALLALFGGTWYKPVRFPEDWETHQDLAALYSRGQNTLGEKSDVFFFKDPRTSICLPFWRKVDPSLKLAMALRRPGDVVKSLESRQNSPVDSALGYFLWAEYNRRILEDGHDRLSCVTFYDNYFSSPTEEIGMIVSRLGISTDKEAAKKALDQVVSPQLRHNRGEGKEEHYPHPSIEEFFILLKTVHQAQFNSDAKLFQRSLSNALDFAQNNAGFHDYLNRSQSLLTRAFDGMGVKKWLQNKIQKKVGKINKRLAALKGRRPV